MGVSPLGELELPEEEDEAEKAEKHEQAETKPRKNGKKQNT